MWQMIALSAFVVSVSGHGRVLDPPGRASMWRKGYPTPHNYDDDGLNCGGFHTQYGVNHGLCGACGDAYNMATPRTHELGGKYGLGIIVAEYEAGEVVEMTVQLSVYHKGYWYFKICTDPTSESNQECFDEHQLELEDGGYLYYPSTGGTFTVRYRIPDDISCEHCVLQWRYVAGNNWGICEDGRGELGCGDQETFGACSDIKITPNKYLSAESIPLPLSAMIGNFEGEANTK
ncbi:uncharacterized protein LOC126973912 [Leptidea sinapis]|uniref:Chitin-binding type-4 domain-containing protein n=1 Tax=Leptidea sinapis TaxID=189913 RepID=A0A5E4QA79_9NEOP|nr:uncharacterized protein LOC126973912 [Leptidea sinapis]VVC94563.1 unnamed protein product [Leptidea sinapis]